MKNIAVSALLSLATLSAHAAPDLQWKDASTTFATLIQSGYKLAAVDHASSPGSPGLLTTVYYLQKEASVFACNEAHRAPDAKTGSATGEFTCSELVQPYDSMAPAQQ
ncbi:MAG: hypothetical protein ABSD12_07875 [Paraburkholderia sp.]